MFGTPQLPGGILDVYSHAVVPRSPHIAIRPDIRSTARTDTPEDGTHRSPDAGPSGIRFRRRLYAGCSRPTGVAEIPDRERRDGGDGTSRGESHARQSEEDVNTHS